MKKLKLLSLFSLVMVASIVLVACGNVGKSQVINFIVGYENMSVKYSEAHDSLIIVRTLQEWSALSASRVFLSELNVKYNESFFSENALIVYAFTSGNSPAQFEITKITRNGNELVMDATDNSGDIGVVSQGIIILEVKISDMQGANRLRVVLS